MKELNKLTLKEFRFLPKNERFEIAKSYWGNATAFSQSELFAFSYSQFSTDCSNMGFKKEKVYLITDTSSNDVPESDDLTIFTLSNENRPTKKQKTFTLNQDTIKEMDAFFDGLSDIEKSRINDMILKQRYSELNKLKEQHKLKIEYAADTRTRIL